MPVPMKWDFVAHLVRDALDIQEFQNSTDIKNDLTGVYERPRGKDLMEYADRSDWKSFFPMGLCASFFRCYL